MVYLPGHICFQNLRGKDTVKFSPEKPRGLFYCAHQIYMGARYPSQLPWVVSVPLSLGVGTYATSCPNHAICVVSGVDHANV